MVEPMDDLNRDTEVGMPHPRIQGRSARKGKAPSLSNTMPIVRRTVFEGPNIASRVYLEVHGLPHGVEVVDLSEKPVNLGRSPECTIHLPLGNVSREHAQVVQRNDEYFLEDLGSTNGTYVNGVRVKKCLLRNNDQIEIGEARIHYVEERVVGRPS